MLRFTPFVLSIINQQNMSHKNNNLIILLLCHDLFKHIVVLGFVDPFI